MRANEFITEARSHPEQNRKFDSGKHELYRWMADHNMGPRGMWGISMTMLPKLGINPGKGVSEDTPKGIYFYPIWYIVGWLNGNKELPWGSDFPYIQLFQYNDSHRLTQKTQVNPEKVKQALRQYCPEEIIEQTKYNGDAYWFIYNCLVQLGKGDETTIIRWNKVLRDLGFTSVLDEGAGWIAHNEPVQGIILDPRIIKQVKTFENYQRQINEDRGQGAAGIVLYAEDTGRYGLQQRSNEINDPGLWAAWGGGREPGETLEQCARRELAEEGGYTGPIKLKRIGENAKYVTFLGTIPHEFEPRANPEWQDYCWVEAGDWPGPMHPGTAAALKNIPLAEDVRTADQFNGINLSIETIKDDEYVDDDDTENQVVYVKATSNGKELGYVVFSIDGEYLIPQDLEVEERFRGQGIAQIMYDYVKSKGYKIQRSSDQTDAGAGFWDKYRPDQTVWENFADGKKPGRKGLAKRSGVNCKQPVSKLRSIAANSSGEKQRMAHWCANMKSGKKKANEDEISYDGPYDGHNFGGSQIG